jgi:putative ABC transport system permease protein
VIYTALRDLLWRRRRYMISIVGCGLVFGMSLLMSGLSSAFPLEITRTVDALGAQQFLEPVGVNGPFTGAKAFAASKIPSGALPFAFTTQSANPEHPQAIVLIGVKTGSGEEPKVTSGRQLHGANDALVDDASPFATGTHINLGGHSFTVVGRLTDFSLNAGTPGVVIPIAAIQRDFLNGLPLVTGAIVEHRSSAPPGFHLVNRQQTLADTLLSLGSARQSIDLVKILLWIVAALIVGSVVFLSVIERTTDFAVFKAIGTSTGSIGAGLAIQSVALAVSASAVGIAVGLLLAPEFPIPVAISSGAAILLPVVAIVVGLVASLFGLRRVIRIEPALAFGGHT